MTPPPVSPPPVPPKSVPPPASRRLGHIAGFVVSGAAAFLTDVAVTKGLHAAFGWPWAVNRVLAIAVAMLVAWLCHRRLTFAVPTPPTPREFAAYAGMAWSAAALNYGLFLLVLWAAPHLDPAVGIALASAVAMIYSYAAMRFGVFRR